LTDQTIFLAALEIADLAERVAYLGRACAGDAALRQQVDALLAAHERPGAFLDVPACEQMAVGVSGPDHGRVAGEARAAGATNVAERAERHDLDETQAEPHEDDDESVLDFLQPPTRPGALGRLGHYEVLEVLGSGGFGIVLKAFDEMLHRVVAIKVMAPRLASTSPARKRFLREARAAAAIRHESVVDIHAVAEEPIPYLVMEYIAGETLQQKLDRIGPLEVPEVLRIGQQVAKGLAAAHALGLLHRDIKPGNIMLEDGVEQRVKITDFGLARAADDASLTQSGYVAGTPMYMAPEQALGHAIDHRADLFSLGSVLYVMCSGRPPFRAANTLAVLRRVAEDTPRPIQEIIPEVPAWLCAVVARLHSKNPADRFSSAKEMADLLARYEAQLHRHEGMSPLSSVPRAASEPAPAASEPVASARPQIGGTPESGPPAAPEATRNGRRRLRWLVPLAAGTVLMGVLVLAGVVLVLAGVVLVRALRQPRGEAPADPKAPVVFRASADQPWQDTGVDVVEGEAVVLVPKGAWRKGKETCSAGGLEQAPRDRAVWPEAPLLSLLVRIGDEPTPTPVRQRDVFKPRRSGRLFVQSNDLDLKGNSDALELTVTGGLRLGDAAPPPALLPIQAADRDWKPILARAEAPGANLDQVREDVLDYCQKCAGGQHASAAARLLRKLPPLVNSIGMKLAPIPPGKFTMGSPEKEPGREAHEGPRHEVAITKPFYMGVHEVTVGQFRLFVTETKYQTDAEKAGEGSYALSPMGEWKNDPQANWQSPRFEQADDHPVVCVSWNDAKAYCEWLSRKEGKSYTLPTEAQWEYCCRAGSQTKFGFGDNDEELAEYAWFISNSEKRTHPVGEKKASAWGLYDMHGNAWEWTADRYAADYYTNSPKEDPPGPAVGESRVLRGVGWNDFVPSCRTAYRHGDAAPSSRTSYVGFRVALLR
jgi:formylglycine-generating enzyme required for sulfatase activity/serine/threonine protein kinase